MEKHHPTHPAQGGEQAVESRAAIFGRRGLLAWSWRRALTWIAAVVAAAAVLATPLAPPSSAPSAELPIFTSPAPAPVPGGDGDALDAALAPGGAPGAAPGEAPGLAHVPGLPELDEIPLPVPASRSGPWTNSRCGSCHTPDPLFSHRIDVLPSMATPASLPLEGGKMTCMTCHADDAASHTLARQNHSPMLRDGLAPEALCALCHDPAQKDRRSIHGATLRRAHTQGAFATARRSNAAAASRAGPASAAGSVSASPASFAQTPTSAAGAALRSPTLAAQSGLDARTQLCMSCHDGSLAGDADGGGFRGPGALGATHGSDHPIGVTYGRASAPRYGGGPAVELAPVGALHARFRLFAGNLGCETCHSVYSPQPGLLVMSNQRGALCLSCHRQ